MHLRFSSQTSLSLVIARLDRAFQYSKGRCAYTNASGILVAPLEAGHDSGGRRTSAFSRRDASEFCVLTTLNDQEGAGNAGCPLHPWSACSKKARGRTTGSAETTGIPRAMVLR